MKVQILTQGLVLNQDEQNYVREKIENLTKYAERIADESTKVKVELTRKRLKAVGNGINCQVTMFVPGALIRAEVRAATPKETIDLVIEKLKKQIKRYKDKSKIHDRIKPVNMGRVLDEYKAERKAEGLTSQVVRRKIFADTLPMQEEEAISQMELLGHKFFLFLNELTGRYSVAYKREEGDYGVIEIGVKEEEFEGK